MRNKFFDTLLPYAKKDKRVMVLMSDTGATVLQQWKKELPKQVVNVGIAEQNMIGLATGLAMEGFLPYCYGIIPFMTSRCHDQVRVNVCCQELPVTIVGVGTGYNYNTLGPTHHGVEDISIMRALPNLRIFSPSDDTVTGAVTKVTYKNPKPTYVRVDREGKPNFHQIKPKVHKVSVLKKGFDYTIISTGRMSYHCLEVIDRVRVLCGKEGTLYDLTQLKPFNVLDSFKVLSQPLIVVEEHSPIGGLGSVLRDKGLQVDYHFSAPDKPVRIYGSREDLKKSVGLDIETLVAKIKSVLY